MIDLKKIVIYDIISCIIGVIIYKILELSFYNKGSILLINIGSIIIIILVLFFTTLYLKENPKTTTRDGLYIGFIWFIMDILLTLPYFLLTDPIIFQNNSYGLLLIPYINMIIIPPALSYIKETYSDTIYD